MALYYVSGKISQCAILKIQNPSLLTHLDPEIMAAILQTTCWNAYCSWMKYINFDQNLTDVKLTISSIGSDNGLVPTTRQTIIWTDDGPVWYSAYASLDLNGLMSFNINHFLQMIRVDAIDSCFRINKRQNDRHFADDIFKFTSLYDFVLWLLFWLKLLWNLFPKVQLIINMSSLIHWTGFQ